MITPTDEVHSWQVNISSETIYSTLEDIEYDEALCKVFESDKLIIVQ